MKALITGITGFLGSHLAEHLLAEGVEVEGTTHYPDSGDFPKSNLTGFKDRVAVHHDIQIHDRDSIIDFLENRNYDYIFHLAAERFITSTSWILNVNIRGTSYLLEAVLYSNQHPVIVLAGCSDMYGNPPLVDVRPRKRGSHGFFEPVINSVPDKTPRLPITEDFPLNPVSTYGVSKAAQDMLGYQYHKEYGMKIVRTRIFDITGPRSHPSHLPSYLARQMVGIETGGQDSNIRIASPEYRRDYTDVRDVARALWLAATKCRYEDAYNICSNKSRTVQQVIDILGMQSTAQFRVVEDRSMMCPSDIIAQEGDCQRFYRKTGWKPDIGFAQSMCDLLDYWRGRTAPYGSSVQEPITGGDIK